MVVVVVVGPGCRPPGVTTLGNAGDETSFALFSNKLVKVDTPFEPPVPVTTILTGAVERLFGPVSLLCACRAAFDPRLVLASVRVITGAADRLVSICNEGTTRVLGRVVVGAGARFMVKLLLML